MKLRFIFPLLSAFFLASPVVAEQPLLQEGKKTVFQRAVSHPGAVLFSDPAGSKKIGTPRTFTSYYIYAKQKGMVKVGVSTSKSDGWIKADKLTDWPQAITMLFTDQMGRQPVLFFKEHDQLQSLCEADSIQGSVSQFIELFKSSAHIPEDCPVLATEPLEEQGQLSQKNFYLLPVLDMDTNYKEGGTLLLEVACIDPGVQNASDKEKNKPAPVENMSMKVGLVFVIDTTISMGPYIDQTKEIIKTIFDKLQTSKAKDNVALAIVGFRSNLKKSPKIEYTTKVISDFTTVSSRDKLENMLKDFNECKASTHAFDEDSLAGVQEAVDSLSWDGISAKAMLLVTDAGPLAGSDPTSKTGMSPEGMADYLRKNNIFLTAVHIKTPSGKRDHAYAEKSYRQLSLKSNGNSSYVAINAKNPAEGAKEFRRIAKQVGEVYADLVQKEFKKGQKPSVKAPSKDASPEEQTKQMSEAIGYSMKLQFRGDQKQTRAPSVVKAWIADADLAALEQNPNEAPVPVVSPAVLLTKLQLSQLRKQLKNMISTAREAFLQGNENFNFYEQLISAAAQMSRDPSSFNQDPNANLAQKGVLLEVLDGLPYKSRVLGLQQDDWTNMSTGEQKEFIKRLQGLIRLYEEYDRDNEHWEGFGSKEANEWVYRVPLSVLP